MDDVTAIKEILKLGLTKGIFNEINTMKLVVAYLDNDGKSQDAAFLDKYLMSHAEEYDMNVRNFLQK